MAPGVKTEMPVASDSEECKVLMVWTACLGLMERPGHKESVESLVIPENEDPSVSCIVCSRELGKFVDYHFFSSLIFVLLRTCWI